MLSCLIRCVMYVIFSCLFHRSVGDSYSWSWTHYLQKMYIIRMIVKLQAKSYLIFAIRCVKAAVDPYLLFLHFI